MCGELFYYCIVIMVEEQMVSSQWSGLAFLIPQNSRFLIICLQALLSLLKFPPLLELPLIWKEDEIMQPR